jgi:hypothetical protein
MTPREVQVWVRPHAHAHTRTLDDRELTSILPFKPVPKSESQNEKAPRKGGEGGGRRRVAKRPIIIKAVARHHLLIHPPSQSTDQRLLSLKPTRASSPIPSPVHPIGHPLAWRGRRLPFSSTRQLSLRIGQRHGWTRTRRILRPSINAPHVRPSSSSSTPAFAAFVLRLAPQPPFPLAQSPRFVRLPNSHVPLDSLSFSQRTRLFRLPVQSAKRWSRRWTQVQLARVHFQLLVRAYLERDRREGHHRSPNRSRRGVEQRSSRTSNLCPSFNDRHLVRPRRRVRLATTRRHHASRRDRL